jgi:predicted ArsR family transcriptional regulator
MDDAQKRLDAVGDPALRDALLYVRGEDRSVTADDLAAHSGVHRNVARSRLERLVAAGLLDVGFERRSGREGPGGGRPAKTYRATPELTGIEFPARRYETLLGLLAEGVSPRRLGAVGVAFGHELARTAGLTATRGRRRGFDRLCAALRSLGYQATVEQADDTRAVIATPTCPLRPLVVAHPETAAIDQGMWVGLAEAALAGVSAEAVTCGTHGCLDSHESCRITIELQEGTS